ncbi:MAG: VOC family protein [Myxococcales bacterium]|nr:VOC family protein [Myxococcales bacterium]
MIDHYSLIVRDYGVSKAFYLAALAPLGYGLVMQLSKAEVPHLPYDEICGLGVGGKPDLWLRPALEDPVSPTHIAFRAESREAVDAFYRAALEAGGRDNGAPGLRPQYHPNYYGAFVLDPDGYNIEAVHHG